MRTRFTLLTRFSFVSILALLLAASYAFAYPWTRVLKQGDTGADVKELQIRIAGWVALAPKQVYLNVSGTFDTATTQTLRRFQNGYRLPINGTVDAATQTALNALEKADGSTAHFSWSEFQSHDGMGFSNGNVPAAEVQENVRRLMYKLEALRHKMGDKSVTITSGFRSQPDNAAAGGASNSMHLYGDAADFGVSGYTIRQIYDVAETCGFSGMENYNENHQHVDSRKEYPSYGSNFWWWESGTDPLAGAVNDPPTLSDVAALLRAASGLASGQPYKAWDFAPNPSDTDPRGLGDGRIGPEDAVRALRRYKGLETYWP